MKQKYEDRDFQAKSRSLISMMNEMLTSYEKRGWVLTVRQLYYQCVARGYIENSMRSYKNLSSLINDGRMAGLLDWDVIEDRTRKITKKSNWGSPADIVDAAASSFHRDMWKDQDCRVIVIVEKEALVGVMERAAEEYDLHLFAARGYPSVTVLREMALGVMYRSYQADQRVLILHFGDHDPSGLDMTRDLRERLEVFNQGRCDWSLKRMALNYDQVEEYNPPPNPAKVGDSRFEKYEEEFGTSSWELDALEPEVLLSLVKGAVDAVVDQDKWDALVQKIDDEKARLSEVADNFRAREEDEGHDE